MLWVSFRLNLLSVFLFFQINQLREQRDRAEKEVKEEKDLHERELTDYKMKIHSLESEVEKLQVRLDKAYVEKVKQCQAIIKVICCICAPILDEFLNQ
jgi:uncharacterized protein YlxW (UPF0749 family)